MIEGLFKKRNLLTALILFGTAVGCSSGDKDDDGVSATPSECTESYPEQSTSLYNLPYSIGTAYIVGQGNCTDGSHSDDQNYAYDFDMPVGTIIIASREGTVVAVEERFEDGNGTSGQENFVIVRHSDNTVSGYYHLTQDGVQVEVGASISQGDAIALSGNTGDSSEPHLHFEVLECLDCDTLPVNFRNTRSHSNGLVEGENYEAF